MAFKLNLPEFYTDKSFTAGQDYLFPFGTSLLEGKPNAYYAPIGATGSQEFEDVLNMGKRDVTKSVLEDVTRRGVGRGGVASTAIAKATADMSRTMRWDDYLRAMSGRKSLMDTGLNAVTGVRNAGLEYGGQKNQYNINSAQLQLSVDQMNEQKKQAQNKMWADILSAAIGSAGTIAGFGMLGKLGAAGGGGGGSVIPSFSGYSPGNMRSGFNMIYP